MKRRTRTCALVIGLSVALAACQATQTRPENSTTQTEEPPQPQMEAIATDTVAAKAAETENETERTPEPSGLEALAGHWAGHWSGGSPSTLTVTTDPDSVEYCYQAECWTIRKYTVRTRPCGGRTGDGGLSSPARVTRSEGSSRTPQGRPGST